MVILTYIPLFDENGLVKYQVKFKACSSHYVGIQLFLPHSRISTQISTIFLYYKFLSKIWLPVNIGRNQSSRSIFANGNVLISSYKITTIFKYEDSLGDKILRDDCALKHPLSKMRSKFTKSLTVCCMWV